MKSILFSASVIFLTAVVFAQPPDTLWTRVTGFYHMDITSDGGVIGARLESLHRLDSSGDQVWEIPLLFRPYTVTRIEEDKILVGGKDFYGETGKLTLFDSSGSEEWTYSWDYQFNEYSQDVLELPDGEILLLRNLHFGMLLTWLSPSGHFLNDQYYEGYFPIQMERMADGVLLSGSHTLDFYTFNEQYMVCKVLHNGTMEWDFIFGHDYSVSRHAFQLACGAIFSLGTLHYDGGVILLGERGCWLHRESPARWADLSPIHALEFADHKIVAVTARGGNQSWLITKLNFEFTVLWQIETMHHLVSPGYSDIGLSWDGSMYYLGQSDSDERRLFKYEPEATVLSVPDVQVVPPGSSTVLFDSQIDNILTMETTLDYWATLFPPAGEPRLVASEIDILIQPGISLQRVDSMNISEIDPPGEYRCRVYVGDKSRDMVLGGNEFRFEKNSDVQQSRSDLALQPSPFELSLRPNPCNGSTTISFVLPEPSPVQIVLYDLLGREVALLSDGHFGAGEHMLSVNLSSHASGMYLVKIQTIYGNTGLSKLVLLN